MATTAATLYAADDAMATTLTAKPYTSDDAAEYFGVNRETVYRWVRKGLLKSCERNGRALRFLPEHFEEFLTGPKEAAEPVPVKPSRNPKYTTSR